MTLSASTNYEIGTLSTATLTASGATATFTVRQKAGLSAGTYTEIITISGGGAKATVGVIFTVVAAEPKLTGISALSVATNGGAAVFVNAGQYGIEDDGEGNFHATLYGVNADTLTIYGVRYVIEAVDLPVTQVDVDGVYYFAPINLPALSVAGSRYEIVSRPDTVGGTAPRINARGQFIFNQQALSINISRAGEYVVRAVDAYGNVVNVYIITVK